MSDRAARPLLSATVLLLRDGTRGLEVFMAERSHQIDFTTGALVFPGGKVDEEDASPRLREACRGVGECAAEEVGARVAAIRETFEECGVLLARDHGREGLLEATRLSEIEDRYGADLRSGRVGFGDLVEAEGLELAGDSLVPFARWITPVVLPKRFDTYFFLAAAPRDQLALHDGVELVDSLWTTAEEALEAGRQGLRTIIFPTRANLAKLGRSCDVRAALDRAHSAPVVTVLPYVEDDAQGKPALHIPPEADYEISSVSLDEILR